MNRPKWCPMVGTNYPTFPCDWYCVECLKDRMGEPLYEDKPTTASEAIEQILNRAYPSVDRKTVGEVRAEQELRGALFQEGLKLKGWKLGR